MGCSSCGNSKGGIPTGCKSNGHCASGGCNKMNTFDWLTDLELGDADLFPIVEVSFKKGARKDFFQNPLGHNVITGDMVTVDSGSGQDVGQVSLSGELVRMQMKKKNVTENRVLLKVLRKAGHRDMDNLQEARDKEKNMMVRARVIARTLDLDMKIGDVELQGDLRKATFYYTANGRVDFRELVRNYAKEFRVKIEMRQIGSRQESARIGGIGSCGRELCCSTWLSDFKSVSTSAARYQSISINQSKLSGQCGRLKCCLNYELDTYMDALSTFPKKVDTLHAKNGKASLLKMDIFKGIIYYTFETSKGMRGPVLALEKDQVKKIKEMNMKKEYPEDLKQFVNYDLIETSKDEDLEFADVTGEIELPSVKKKRRSGRNRSRDKRKKSGNSRNRPNNKSDKPKSNKPKQSNKAKSGAAPKKKDNRPDQKRSNKPKSSNKVKSSEADKKWDERPSSKSDKPNKPSKKRKYYSKKKSAPKKD